MQELSKPTAWLENVTGLKLQNNQAYIPSVPGPGSYSGTNYSGGSGKKLIDAPDVLTLNGSGYSSRRGGDGVGVGFGSAIGGYSLLGNDLISSSPLTTNISESVGGNYSGMSGFENWWGNFSAEVQRDLPAMGPFVPLMGQAASGVYGAVKLGLGVGAYSSGNSMVLGRVGSYERLADQLGAKKFTIPRDVWAKMSLPERRSANFRSIDRSIKRGDSFIFSNQPSEAYPGSGFAAEIQYLRSKGINTDDIPVISPW